MKEFLKMFFASLLAMVFAAAGLFVFLLVLFSVIGSLSKPAPKVVDGSILVFDMTASVQDRPVGMSRDAFLDQAIGGALRPIYSLHSLTKGIRAAAEDDRIEGLLLTGSFVVDGYSSGFAALKEVRGAVEAFKQSGKPVWAYVVYPSSRDLYVISTADTIVMNPEGVVSDTGMAMSYPYFGGFLEKYGIGVQVTRAGEYKAAAESFVLEGMSGPAREANEAVLADFWEEYLAALAQGVEAEPHAYEDMLNRLGMLTAHDALEFGLVDELLHTEALIRKLQAVSGVDRETKSFQQTLMGQYLADKVKPQYSSDGYVSVIYAEGSIVHGEGDDGQVGGASLSREIRQARQDDKVKAIVLRVNSPGGSALASEVIQHELRLAREKMPVVVSMGAVAASGGYWISAYGDKIYAQPNTLTGSIGVIGVLFNYEKIANEHGVNFDSVKTTEHADIFGAYRAKSEEEMGLIQRQVDLIYDAFLNKVAEGRGMEVERVREIAGGRIWSGVDALEIGLVDELGGLGDAIAHAGREAGLGETPAIQERPKPVNFLEELLGGMAHKKADAQVGPAAQPLLELYRQVSALSEQFNDPKGVYAVLPYEVNVK